MKFKANADFKTYFLVFAWLIVFTIIEVFAAGLACPKLWIAAILLATAIGKALLIALFFMHMKHENNLVWLLPGIPVLFVLIFILGIYPDLALHMTLKM